VAYVYIPNSFAYPRSFSEEGPGGPGTHDSTPCKISTNWDLKFRVTVAWMVEGLSQSVELQGGGVVCPWPSLSLFASYIVIPAGTPQDVIVGFPGVQWRHYTDAVSPFSATVSCLSCACSETRSWPVARWVRVVGRVPSVLAWWCTCLTRRRVPARPTVVLCKDDAFYEVVSSSSLTGVIQSCALPDAWNDQSMTTASWMSVPEVTSLKC